MIRDNLCESSTNIEIMSYLVYDIETIFSTTRKNEGVKVKSYGDNGD